MRFPSTRRGRLPGLPLAATFLLCAVGLTALPARPGTLERAQITERVFPSGLRLVVKEAHATDLACVQVWVRAGGFQESATSSGTAHVIEHLVFKGTEVRGPGAIDAEIENLGGLLEASTDKDWSRFGCTVAGRFAPQVIQIIGDAVRKPQFRPADWEAEKPVILEEIAQVRISPESYVGAQLYELAFDKHPYRLDVRGTAPNVSRLNLDTVRAAYKRSYAPGNMTMVVVGHVETAAIERAVSAALGSEPPAAPSAAGPLPPAEAACARPQRKVSQGNFSSGYVGLAFPAPSVKDQPDVYAMDLLLTLLEHENGGRLPRLLRGQAAVQARFETRRQPGILSIVASTGSTPPEDVEALIRKELDFLRNHPVTAAELAVAKRALRGSYALDNETLSGQASSLGYYDAIDTWQFACEYLSQVEAITPAQLNEVVHKYVLLDRCVTLVLKPRATGGVPPRGNVQ